MHTVWSIRMKSRAERPVRLNNSFFVFSGFVPEENYEILPDKGRISHKDAAAKAEAEYDAFNKTQWILSDFDKEVKRLFESGVFYQRQS